MGLLRALHWAPALHRFQDPDPSLLAAAELLQAWDEACKQSDSLAERSWQSVREFSTSQLQWIRNQSTD